MKKLRAKLASLLHSLSIQEPLHARAVRRMTKHHEGQKKAERQAAAAREAADRLRREGHHFLDIGPQHDQARGERKLRRAARKDKKAGTLDVKAEREKTRA